TFIGGVDVTLGDFNGDGRLELITGAGPTGAPEVKVYDGLSLSKGKFVQIAGFFAFSTRFQGGVEVDAYLSNFLAMPNVFRALLFVGAGPSTAPQVNAYVGSTLASGTAIGGFFAQPQNSQAGVHV